MHSSYRGALFILVASILFASYAIWSRYIGGFFGDFFQAYTRALFILLILVPIGYFRKSFKRILPEDVKWYLIIIMFSSMAYAPIYYAFNNMTIGSAMLVFYSSLVISMFLLGYFFFNEKFTPVKIMALILALLGLGIVFSFSIKASGVLPVIAAVINGVAGAGEGVFSKKVSKKYSILQIITFIFFSVLVTNFFISVFLIKEPQIFLSFSFPWFIQIIFVLTALGANFLVVGGLRLVDASTGGLIGLSEVIFGILFGVVIFLEKITVPVFIGGILILTAMALPYFVEYYHLRQRYIPVQKNSA